MTKQSRQLAKDFLPPILTRLLNKRNKYGCFGNYSTWEEAQNASTGYDSDLILEKVKNSVLKVKIGKAVYERDSVLFDEIQYSWLLLAGLLWVTSTNRGRLSVLDFGGSLGSTYFQNRKFLSDLPELTWSIVEQKNFVECGKSYFEDEHLKFYYDIETCIQKERPQVIILSAVIQYLEKPYDIIETILGKGFEYIIFDRMPFLETGNERLTVRKVPPEIYKASYPAWFFNEKKFLSFFQEKYELIEGFETTHKVNIPSVFKGYIFRRKANIMKPAAL